VVPDRVTIIGEDRVIDEPYRRRMNYSNIQKVLDVAQLKLIVNFMNFFWRYFTTKIL